jgi:hypothetical protein
MLFTPYYFDEETYVYFNENPYFAVNVADKNQRFLKAKITLINTMKRTIKQVHLLGILQLSGQKEETK